MSKNEKAKTKSATAIVRAKTSARTTENTMQVLKKERLDIEGCRLLANRIIRSAYDDNDTEFFFSPVYDFWAAIAYNGKMDYWCKEIVDKIYLKKKNNVKQQNRGRPCV